jgi:hypothetical protein
VVNVSTRTGVNSFCGQILGPCTKISLNVRSSFESDGPPFWQDQFTGLGRKGRSSKTTLTLY